MRSILNPEAVQAYIRLHKKMALPFTIILSSYTTRIVSKYCDEYFMKNQQSKSMFAAFAKIKKDISGKEVDKINPYGLQYFSTIPFKTDFFADKVFNIDIKAAYATILFRDGYISRKTYKYLTTLPKLERLAAVGMLAGKKNVYEVDSFGQIISKEKIISPTSDYFFYCVKKTSQLINEAQNILGSSFIFSWVDGIYFSTNQPEIKAKEVNKMFSFYGLKTTFETLEDFHVKIYKEFYAASYLKDGKRKTINVPIADNEFTKKITEYLQQKDY